MCTGIETALAIASAVSAATSTYAQMEQAGAQKRLLDDQRQAQAEEIAAKRDQTIGERVAAARREASRRLVAAGEAGVGGQSVAADLMNTLGRANKDAAVTNKQAAFEDRASQTEYASELARIQKPTVLDAGLQIAGGYQSGYAAGGALKDAYKGTVGKLKIKSKG